MSNKLVAIQVIYPFPIYGVESTEVYEIDFESVSHVDDLTTITSKLQVKCSEVTKLLSENNAVFTRESTFVKGLWSVIGEKSPVKDRVLIKCAFKPKRLFVENASLTDSSSNSISSGATNSSLPVFQSRSNINDGDGSGQNPTLQPLVLAICPEKSDVAYVENELGLSCFSGIGAGEVLELNVGGASVAAESQTVMAAVKKKMYGSQSLKTTIPVNYQLPTAFNDGLKGKLRDPTEVLWPSEKAELLREVRKSLWVHTKEPSSVDLQYVVRKLVEKYPNLIHAENNKETEIHAMIADLRRKFQRERAKQTKDKTAPPAKRKKSSLEVNLTPGDKKVPLEFDQVSYDANVDKMVDEFEKKTDIDTNAIEVLMERTFKGRRAEIEHQNFNEIIKNYISRKCPFLINSCHLYAEMDRMKGVGICAKFRQAWMDIVPAILFAAKSRKTTTIVKFLRLPRFENLKDDFDVQSRAAMELLPILMAGTKTGSQARRHFVDYREDSASLAGSLTDVKDRIKPFILSLGGSLHIIVDSDLFMRADTSLEALLMLLCAYFVYNFRYSDHVLPSLLFLQSQCLGLNDDVTPKSGSVATLVKIIDKYKLDNANVAE